MKSTGSRINNINMKQLEKLAIVLVALFIFTVCGAVQIDNCNNGAVYTTDDTSNPTGITCSGLSQNDVVGWYTTQNGQKTIVANCDKAVCGPTYPVSYVIAVRDQVSGTSNLIFVQNIRQNADGALVYCNSANCVIRVTDALPTVTLDVDGGMTHFNVGDTATLRCSTSRSPPSPLYYTYTWYISCDVQQSGNVCQFTVKSEHNRRQVSCTVTYTQYPYIAGKTAYVTIHVIASSTATTAAGGSQASSPTTPFTTTTLTANPNMTRSNSGSPTTAALGTTAPWVSTRTTESNSRGPSTNATSGTARSSNAIGTTAGSSQPFTNAGALESMSVGNSDDPPFAAIIGGVIGTVVAAIIIVIVAVFLIKRRKKQPKTAPPQKRSPRDEDDFEEHVNPIYGTEDPNSKRKVVEDDVEDVGYAAVGPTHQPHTTHTDVYQPVNPSSANGAGRPTAPDQRGEHLYNSVDGDALQAANVGRCLHKPYQAGPSHAVVDKSGSSQAQAANPSEDVYAVVNKNKSRQISQPKSALKSKPQSKSAEEPDGDYNKLNFHPSTNPARDPGNPEQLYNHLS